MAATTYPKWFAPLQREEFAQRALALGIKRPSSDKRCYEMWLELAPDEEPRDEYHRLMVCRGASMDGMFADPSAPFPPDERPAT